MRKKRAFLITFILLFFLSGKANATFNIETDLTAINFGTVSPNEVRENIPSQGVTVRCTTDQGNAWNLRIRIEQPFAHINNPASTIANENFWWYGMSTTGTGTLVTAENDFSVEKIVYSAPRGEGSSGVDVNIKFKLMVPLDAQSGEYSTTIVLTLIE